MALTLLARLERFRDIVAGTVVTDRAGTAMALEAGMASLLQQLVRLRERRGQLYIIGNGGSAGVAAHAVTDFFNVARLRASTLHESSLLTCMANDYGYENAFARMLSQMLVPEDMLIAISSSGNSANIRNAVSTAREIGACSVTFSGFHDTNPLRTMGDANVWLDSRDYGFVEIGHQFVLHNLADRLNDKLKGQ